MVKAFFSLMVLFLFVNDTVANDIKSLNPIEELVVKVPHFKEAMTYNVTLPDGYSELPHKKYFVLFDLHPRSQPFLAGTQDWLSHNGEWPWLQTIIVNPANYHQEFATLLEETAKNPKNSKMLEVFEQHIMKQIANNYRTNGFNIYSGFMSNAAIGLYLLAHKPNLFNAYLLATPTLADNFLSLETEFEKRVTSLTDKKRFLYITIGDHAYEKAHRAGVDYIHQILEKRAPKYLSWEVDDTRENYYMTRPVMTVLNGIEKLFDDYHKPLAPDSSISRQGANAIIEYYKELSDLKYGFPVSAEQSLKRLAKTKLLNEPQAALSIYEKVMKLYPESAYAYSDAAAAYKNQGSIVKAISLQKIAVEKAKQMSVWHQNNHKKILKQLQEQVN